ncbi:hypothetical protein ABZ926_32730 [Streptomyces litmocidini]|uniref:hypothetical protein n=1 Tax=Streptomyces litmocidini TaxID=67318 RepID=UPI0034087216
MTRTENEADQIVFRWDSENLTGNTGFGPVAWSGPRDETENLFQLFGPVLRASGDETRPALIRLRRRDQVVLVRRAPFTDADGRTSVLCHALVGAAPLLAPAVCLGLHGWDWDGAADAAGARGPLPVVPAEALVPAASRGGLPELDRLLPYAAEELVGTVAEFLRHPDDLFTVLDERGDTACPVLWGLHSMLGALTRRPWTFATHDTLELPSLRYVFVGRWSGAASRNTERRRVDPRERCGDRAEEVAARLVRHHLWEVEEGKGRDRVIGRALRTAATTHRGPLLETASRVADRLDAVDPRTSTSRRRNPLPPEPEDRDRGTPLRPAAEPAPGYGGRRDRTAPHPGYEERPGGGYGERREQNPPPSRDEDARGAGYGGAGGRREQSPPPSRDEDARGAGYGGAGGRRDLNAPGARDQDIRDPRDLNAPGARGQGTPGAPDQGAPGFRGQGSPDPRDEDVLDRRYEGTGGRRDQAAPDPWRRGAPEVPDQGFPGDREQDSPGRRHLDPRDPDPRHLDPRDSDPRHPDPRDSDPWHPDFRDPDSRVPDSRKSDPRRSDPRHPDPRHPDTQPPTPRPPASSDSRRSGPADDGYPDPSGSPYPAVPGADPVVRADVPGEAPAVRSDGVPGGAGRGERPAPPGRRPGSDGAPGASWAPDGHGTEPPAGPGRVPPHTPEPPLPPVPPSAPVPRPAEEPRPVDCPRPVLQTVEPEWTGPGKGVRRARRTRAREAGTSLVHKLPTVRSVEEARELVVKGGDRELLDALSRPQAYDVVTVLLREIARRLPSWGRPMRRDLCEVAIAQKLWAVPPHAREDSSEPPEGLRAANAAALHRWAVRPLLGGGDAPVGTVAELLSLLRTSPEPSAREAFWLIVDGERPGLPDAVWLTLLKEACGLPRTAHRPAPPSPAPARPDDPGDGYTRRFLRRAAFLIGGLVVAIVLIGVAQWVR